jgi:hypothetical protein
MAEQRPASASNDFFKDVASGAIPGASTSNHAAGFPNNGGNGGGMGAINKNFKEAFGGDGIDIATSSIDGLAGILKGPKGGIFEDCDIFAAADGSLAVGKLLPHDHLVMAKKAGIKIDVSIVKETGAVLGANLGFSSGGQGQGQG